MVSNPATFNWRVEIETLGGGQRFHVFDGSSIVSFKDYFGFMESNADFRSWYTALIAQSGYEALFWEHPPLTQPTWSNQAEFVLLDGPSLARFEPDPHSFASQFERGDDSVVTFPNLGGDALLVAPCPMVDCAVYPHLTAFLQAAPVDQVHDLWVKTASAVHGQLSDKPVWVSTAGMGVAWLHVRLDSWPKYYRFDPYKIDP